MKKFLLIPLVAASTLLPASAFGQTKWVDVQSAVYHPDHASNAEIIPVATRRRLRHGKRNTVKRVGGGAAGGAAVGALVGGKKGAGIGALAGGGAGAVYDHHKRKTDK